MDETYRMLGREHQADLDREAARRRLASQARRAREPRKPFAVGRRLEAVALTVVRFARRRVRAAPTT